MELSISFSWFFLSKIPSISLIIFDSSGDLDGALIKVINELIAAIKELKVEVQANVRANGIFFFVFF